MFRAGFRLEPATEREQSNVPTLSPYQEIVDGLNRELARRAHQAHRHPAARVHDRQRRAHAVAEGEAQGGGEKWRAEIERITVI